jgi:DNA-directed RNA polymerase specialized sigma subunit
MFGRNVYMKIYAFFFFVRKESFMVNVTQELQCISTEDYFYLTENFAFVDAETRANQVRFLVYDKDKKIMDTVKEVMKNELTEKEYRIAVDYWSNNLSINDISKKHNISRSSFYRLIKEIKEKIDTSLKYVLYYNEIIKPPSIAEFLSQVNSEFSLGEQIES